MNKIAVFICSLLIISQSCQSAPSQKKAKASIKIDHSVWDELLKMHVSPNGKVDYKSFKTESRKLDGYLKSLSRIDISGYSKNEQLAYWINAYNAFTVDLVTRNYPVKSIKDIRNAKSLIAKATGGSQVWIEKLRYAFNGEELSLYNIENDKLLKNLFDPRIHFVINCASYSCPRLWNGAYTAANEEKAMDQMAREFINDPSKNKISANSLQLSEIFKWYKGHFIRNGTLIDYLNKYSKIKINKDARIDYLNYNWNLNE